MSHQANDGNDGLAVPLLCGLFAGAVVLAVLYTAITPWFAIMAAVATTLVATFFVDQVSRSSGEPPKWAPKPKPPAQRSVNDGIERERRKLLRQLEKEFGGNRQQVDEAMKQRWPELVSAQHLWALHHYRGEKFAPVAKEDEPMARPAYGVDERWKTEQHRRASAYCDDVRADRPSARPILSANTVQPGVFTFDQLPDLRTGHTVAGYRQAWRQEAVAEFKKQMDQAEDEAFERDVRADAERVVALLRADYTASMKAWSIDEGLPMNSDDLNKRRERRQLALERAQRTVAQAQDEIFQKRLKEDTERVLAELKAGRMAKLKDWRAELSDATLITPLGPAVPPDDDGTTS